MITYDVQTNADISIHSILTQLAQAGVTGAAFAFFFAKGVLVTEVQPEGRLRSTLCD